MENSRRLLSCLQYPFAADVNFTSKSDVIILACWLEDRKIRELEIDERETLRKDSDQWDTAFGNYLTKLGCPFTWSNINDIASSNDCMSWLIASATSAEYEDASEACMGMEDFVGSDVFSLRRSVNNSSTGMDVVDDTEGVSPLRSAIDDLGSLLDVSRTESTECTNDISYLNKIHKKVKFFLTEGSLHSLKTKGSEGIPLSSFPSPFESNDLLLKQVAIVMRMLYLSDFAELQNDLNSLIVLGQEYTANPKTNSALGAVGR